MEVALDIGCGHAKRESTAATRWIGLDRHDFSRLYPEGEFIVHDLANPLPFAAHSVNMVWCHHVFEHLPPRMFGFSPPQAEPIIFVMNEIWRVLKPGGEAHIIVPWREHTNAWRSPIHYRFFDDGSFRWFSWRSMHEEHEAEGLWSKWQAMRSDVQDNCHVYAILKALAWESEAEYRECCGILEPPGGVKSIL